MWTGYRGILPLVELCHTLFQTGNWDVPACPVFVLAHFPDGGNAGRRQDRIHEPSVLEVLGEQAVMLVMTSPTHPCMSMLQTVIRQQVRLMSSATR